MVTGATALLALASLAWAVIDVDRSATAAYFSTFTRVWQLLGGALLAMFFTRMASLPQRIRPPLAWVGLVLMVASVLLVAPDAGVPAPAGIPVVVGALLLIGAGIEANSHRYMWPLTNRVARYLGRISFSLYLWHWPVVVILADVLPQRDWIYYSSAVALSLVLSAISFELVEKPARMHPRLGGRDPRWHDRAFRTRLKLGYLATAAVAVMALVAVAYVPSPPVTGAVSSDLTAAPANKSKDQQPTIRNPLVAAIQKQLDMSLSSKDFPTLRPGPDDFTALPADRVDYLSQPCVPGAPSPTCTPGDGSAGTAVVLGDSMAQMWEPTIEKSLKPYGYAVERRHKSACPILLLEFDTPERTACNTYQPQVLATVDAEKPDVVFISDLYFSLDHLYQVPPGAASERAWTKARKATLARVAASAKRVVVLTSPPESQDPKTCITRFSSPGDCVTTISDVWNRARAADEAGTEGFKNVTFLDTSTWACSAQTKECPAFVSGMVMRQDRFHMTQAYAEYVAPLLTDELQRSGLLPK